VKQTCKARPHPPAGGPRLPLYGIQDNSGRLIGQAAQIL